MYVFPVVPRGLCGLKKVTVSCNEEQKEIKMEFDLVVRNYDSNPINVSNENDNNLREMLKRAMMVKVRYQRGIALWKV